MGKLSAQKMTMHNKTKYQTRNYSKGIIGLSVSAARNACRYRLPLFARVAPALVAFWSTACAAAAGSTPLPEMMPVSAHQDWGTGSSLPASQSVLMSTVASSAVPWRR
jgi:hypothetical protein